MIKIYEIAYSSYNSYEEHVKDALLEYLVYPCEDASQTLLDYKIAYSSIEDPYIFQNSYGFNIIRIRPQNFTEGFEFSFKATVRKAVQHFSLLDQWPVAEQVACIASREFYIDNYLFYNQTALTTLSPDHENQIFPFDRQIGLLEFFDALTAFVHTVLQYVPDVTPIETTAEQALEMGKGVCQDFTHLFLANARANKLPARYVSGYLHQGAGSLGFAMMHAWAEAYIPGLGWVGFDPTNNVRVDEMYVKVCHGKDYQDCSTIKGVVNTQGKNSTTHQVQVTQQQ